MRHIIEIERHPNGLRVRVLHQRVHHAVAGLLVAAVCVIHDWKDRRDWFKLGAQR